MGTGSFTSLTNRSRRVELALVERFCREYCHRNFVAAGDKRSAGRIYNVGEAKDLTEKSG